MRKQRKIMSTVFLTAVMIMTFLPTSIFADVVVEGTPISNQKIKECVFYGKNPDPSATQEEADYPAVWMLYEDPDGHDNTETFVLKEVASKEEAKNTDMGYEGFRINGKWYKVVKLWTVSPDKDIIDKGHGEKAVFTPLYGPENLQEGEKVFVAIWDYDYVKPGSVEGDPKGGISNLVEITVPKKDGETKVIVNDDSKTAQIPTGKNYTYDGRSKTGVDGGTGYTLSGTTSAVNVGEYTATATLKAGFTWKDGSTGAKQIKWKISKGENKLLLIGITKKTRKLVVKSSKGKKIAAKKYVRISNPAYGKLSFKKVSGNKYIKVNKKTGKLTVPKGLKKRGYVVKVRVTSAATANCYATKKYVKVYVKVR